MVDGKKTPNPIDTHVGNRIRLRRNMIGMSQEKLGEQLGITFQQIQKYEKGTNRVGASRLQAIARIMGVPVAFFFEDAPGSGGRPGFAVAPQQDFAFDMLSAPEGLQLQREFARIKDPKVRRRILDLIKTLAASDDDDSGNR